MKVHFTDEATDDLQRIGDYIARDNPLRALSFIDEMERECLALAASPKAFPMVPRYEKQGIRRKVHGNYLIFYRLDGEQVIVVHILHGAMDYAAVIRES
ncbi:type II toxin-antitoxin system RelE/ParE family toxin [Brucella intermedia]|uniref:type II toxin-antitoxin system RelE/ParE family toxin n=1 Tax=Brucella intermedia TaxID=94625 RepID=UPI00124F3111|nr:type II toxin-antitoxin system RelE/ParE family toxin [Brucella intermedia]KAB2711251.1 type II toxin-antitoxin system RelE/ParE family toxin [Brucella intermedia]MCB4920616.1 type II toxin-antitoxin system RelE/ParE family toxin [Brucella intermedia]MPR61613.1 type II toxin-antitoxin system RelE/ParE family toxin [Brucella intermedia]NYD81537.1 plasmid stabilization system protein ParE [Brucella intermedia]UXO84675.1 type II toxin-antitoxin system RelE/ParE family toxin [Brucella intermedi